ncbi:TPA: hypothetical protein K8054_000265 [Staphylococcus pseudintermedius]|uniref:hypothetical protein n=1 Tax=Staphylococcus pseudintermedius TaxID=283734 RepID=UPI001A0992C9|nr:hypothetical protein [Staphylococcus pseudintermedius]EGQ1716164.1 hypothetical protein [Staphylococcus pseudintermedius]EGQ1765134.1 hypothetical protein [Staphylococcus pseudintermedius]EGQ2719085.1 hypothetical protein [Staphylococcus pseudintermedius]EGQ2729225.1 hypothetical protein [Staphylococcus pseudintermedius]EGQ3289127.1 hypothetical protein [Staphylococcus pseudintermedius]
MKQFIDPDKFASAFVSNPNVSKAENADSSVEHYFDLYIKAFEQAVEYNQTIVEEQKKKQSERSSKIREASKKLRR